MEARWWPWQGKVNRDRHPPAHAPSRSATILFGKYSGTEVKIDGVDHLILRETKSSA